MLTVPFKDPENPMTTESLVKPALPGGFKDYTPAQVLARQRMFAAIEATLRRFAFVPLETSIAQRREVLTGGKPVENRLFDMTVSLADVLAGAIPVDGKAVLVANSDDADKRRWGTFLANGKFMAEWGSEQDRVSARFDLTVPLARYVAANIKDIAFPLRRYECGNVFRGENSQRGRFNQFIQFDADIVGADLGPADAEIILCMAAVMKGLGLERFVIKVNDRKVLNGLAERVGFPLGSKSASALLRTMDKVDKVGVDGVIAELRAKTAPEGEEEAFGFDDARCDLVRGFMTLTDGLTTNAERLAALSAYFGGVGIGAEGVRELELIASLLTAGGMPEDKWVVDPSVARGLGYYTGPVFETYLLDVPNGGSVYSGGRYDDLVARFTGESLPSVGASVGVDRLFDYLQMLAEQRGEKTAGESSVEAYVITMDPTLMPEYFAMANELRAAGVSVEINMNRQDRSIKKQNGIAIFERLARVVLYCGADDVAAGTVGVKDTATRAQVSVPRADLAKHVLAILGRAA